jgi:hypothetical protein
MGCIFRQGTFIIKFKKGRLYPIVKHVDGKWYLENHEEKKGIAMDRRYVTPAILRNYFIPYQPIKRKSKYAKWKKS